MTRIATKEGFTSITKEEDGGQDASSGCARSLHRFIARSARVSTRARFGKDTAREVLVARRGTEPSAVATGSRMTAPCRSRSGSNDRARTHRRLLRLQELGQNLAHAPVRQLIARRQGFLERVADDLRAFARGWGVSAGWPRPRVRAGASERNDSLTGGGGGARRAGPRLPRHRSRAYRVVRDLARLRERVAPRLHRRLRGSRSRHFHTRATHSAVCRRFGRERKVLKNARSRLGRNRESGHHGQLDRSRAGERFFLPFTKRSRVPNRDGRGDFFFRRAPICRCRDAGKRKFGGETKTSVDRRSQNRALTDRRSDENENLSDFLVEKVSIKVTWKENMCQSQRAGKETGLTPEPGFMSPRFRPIFGFHARYLETLEEILREGNKPPRHCSPARRRRRTRDERSGPEPRAHSKAPRRGRARSLPSRPARGTAAEAQKRDPRGAGKKTRACVHPDATGAGRARWRR